MRVRLLQEEFGDKLSFEWRSFLLRPQPGERDLEKFRQYTQNWLKIAADEPSGEFQPWSTDEDPPSHSVPPHTVAKAAERISHEAFETLHDALLKAYFKDNRDITNEKTLLDLWGGSGLAADQFEQSRDPAILKSVIDEHNEAINYGASGAPAWRMSHQPVVIVGAQPVAVLSRWINRVLADEV